MLAVIMPLQALKQIEVKGYTKHECVNCLTAFTETRKAPQMKELLFGQIAKR